MERKRVGAPPNGRDLTMEEWHALLIHAAGENETIRGAVEFFLRTSLSGNAYLEAAKRLRPALQIDGELQLDEVIATHEAAALIGRLIAEPRCGADPEFFIWKDIWQDSTVGDSHLYAIAIEISRSRESRTSSPEELARIRAVRAAIENELRLEAYFCWRQEVTRRRTDL